MVGPLARVAVQTVRVGLTALLLADAQTPFVRLRRRFQVRNGAQCALEVNSLRVLYLALAEVVIVYHVLVRRRLKL